MKRYRLAAGLALAIAGIMPLSTLAETPPPPRAQSAPRDLFDPARHMRVSEVRPGMTGYGLTVFHGSEIERFDVQVVSILHHFNAKNDVVLIRCKGDYLEHTGSIAGMSGSPIFLHDDAGRDRMIGAFAYGWPLTKDPVAGVQPIQYMLQLPVEVRATAGGGNLAPAPVGAIGKQAGWSLSAAGMLPLMHRGNWGLGDRAGGSTIAMTGDRRTPQLEPLATPLMVGGLSPGALAQIAPAFKESGLVLLQAPSGQGVGNPEQAIPLEPGSVLAVPLLTGDLEMTAIGTTTEVLGDEVFGFGHPFNNEGPVSLPMGGGEVQGVIANLQTSFKLGSISKATGTLTTDGSVGVAGLVGKAPRTVPIELTVEPADGSASRTYHFFASRHQKFTPLITAAAFSAAVAGSSELPQENTVDYSMRLAFDNGQTVTLSNRQVNTTAAELFGDAAVVLQAAGENPFARVAISKITGAVKVTAVNQAAQILDVNLPRSRYHPGDKVVAYVNYQPFHQNQAIVPVTLDLPRDLPHGHYQVVISDAQRYFADEQASKPFRFVAESIGDVFAVLKDVAMIREDAIYLRLVRKPDGVAIGRAALASLPSSRREILLASGRSNTTPFVSSLVAIQPMPWVMSGASEFALEVEAPTKVAVGAKRPAK